MEKQKPVHKLRFGRNQAAIWENVSKNGRFFNVTFSRSYSSNGEIKDTSSFGGEDLLAVAKLADVAHSWCYEQGQPPEAEKPTAE